MLLYIQPRKSHIIKCFISVINFQRIKLPTQNPSHMSLQQFIFSKHIMSFIDIYFLPSNIFTARILAEGKATGKEITKEDVKVEKLGFSTELNNIITAITVIMFHCGYLYLKSGPELLSECGSILSITELCFKIVLSWCELDMRGVTKN